jgi:hypothetical protein
MIRFLFLIFSNSSLKAALFSLGPRNYKAQKEAVGERKGVGRTEKTHSVLKVRGFYAFVHSGPLHVEQIPFQKDEARSQIPEDVSILIQSWWEADCAGGRKGAQL